MALERRSFIILLAIAMVWLLIVAGAVASFNSSGDESGVIADAGSGDGGQGDGSAGDDGAGGSDTASTPAPPADDSARATEAPGFEVLSMPSASPSPARTVKLPILMYHHTGEPPAGADELRMGLTVSTADFEAQMAYLKQAGYQTVTGAQMFKALFLGEPLPPQPVMLTFDDGYSDNFDVAAPIMEKYGFAGIFYIVTEKVGVPEYMTWEQVTALDRAGMEVGSHTATHQDLTTLSAADLRQELTGSADTLKTHLGHPVYGLCYPAGKYDADVLRFAREAGYLLATSTEPGEQQSSDAPLVLLRYRMRNDTGLAGFQELVR